MKNNSVKKYKTVKTYKYSLKGKFLCEYESMSEAYKKNKIKRLSSLSEQIYRGLHYVSGNLYFNKKPSEKELNKVVARVKRYEKSPIYIYDKKGNFINVIKTVKEAKEYFGGTYYCFYIFKILKQKKQIVNHKHKVILTLKYKKELSLIDVYKTRRKGNIISISNGGIKKKHPNATEASKDLNIKKSLISRVLNGKLKNTHGYVFKYV